VSPPRLSLAPLEPFDGLAELLEGLRDRADAAGRTEPIDVTYWRPPVLEPADMKRHVTLARCTEKLGVTWLVVRGAGVADSDAQGFVWR
jgi:hypothetical protein